MTTYDSLSRDDQQRSEEILGDLRAAGIRTSVSQVASNFSPCERWATGSLDLVSLALKTGMDTTGMHPVYLQAKSDLSWRVALPVRKFDEAWEVARAADTDTPGDHGHYITLSARVKSGDLRVRNFPVVTVRQRNGKTVRQILLSSRTEEDHGLTTALIPVGGQLVRDFAPCAECNVNTGTILRRDSAGNQGFVCEDDEEKGTFTRRPFPTSW